MTATNPAQVLKVVDNGLAWFDPIHSTTCLFRLADFAKRKRTFTVREAEDPRFIQLLEFHFDKLKHLGQELKGQFARGQALANTALAIEGLLPVAPRVEELVKPLVAETRRALPTFLGVKGARNAANILYGLRDVRASTFMDAFFSDTAKQLAVTRFSGADAQAIANTAFAFAVYGSSSPQTRRLFNVLEALSTARMGDFTLQHLANIAWSFAELGLARGSGPFFTLLADAIIEKLEQKLFHPKSVSLAAFAYGLSNSSNTAFLEALASSSTAHAGQLGASEIPTIMWTFGRLQFRNEQKIQALVRRAEEVLPQMRGRGLCETLWALQKLELAGEYSDFVQKLESTCTQRRLSAKHVALGGLDPNSWVKAVQQMDAGSDKQ